MQKSKGSESELVAIEARTGSRIQHDLLRFVRAISLLTHEDEPDEAGEVSERTSEDAHATLNQLILEARQLLGTSETCSECGATVAYVIGCPDGAEICQDCFDTGRN